MSKTRKLTEQGLEIQYCITNDSFDYQGPNGLLTHKMPDSYEVESISVFIEYTEDWLDVTNDKTMLKLAESLVEADIAKRKEDYE